MREFVDHTDQEVSGIFVHGLGARPPFRKCRYNEALVPPAFIPSTCVGYFPVTFLPELRFVATADQRKHGAGHHRNVRTPDDFEQTDRVRHLFIAPLVAAHYGGAEHLNLRRLNHHEKRLQVAATGAREILVDNDLAPLWGLSERARSEDEQ